MGTTKVKVIDLSSDTPEVKTSRKSAARLAKSSAGLEAKRGKLRPSINTEEKPAEKAVKTRPSIVTNEGAVESAEKIEAPEKKMGAKERAKAEAISGPAPVKTRPHGAKYKKAAEEIEKDKSYSAKDALALLKKTSFTKFDPTVEIHVNVTTKNIRGTVNFPHAIGPKKEKRHLVFSDKLKNSDNKNIILATDTTIDDIVAGKLKPGRDFDNVIAAAKFMPQLTKVARVLGPAGMMPNPKNGTISENPEETVGAGATDAIEFRSDPMAPIVHTKIGKLSSKPEELEENLKAIITAIGAAKVKKAVLTSTMSPAIKLDVTTV